MAQSESLKENKNDASKKMMLAGVKTTKFCPYSYKYFAKIHGLKELYLRQDKALKLGFFFINFQVLFPVVGIDFHFLHQYCKLSW